MCKAQFNYQDARCCSRRVARSFTALIPAFLVAFVVLFINGVFVSLGTDIFKVIAIPFSFVTNIANSWIGLLVIYFLIHALWIVGIHVQIL